MTVKAVSFELTVSFVGLGILMLCKSCHLWGGCPRTLLPLNDPRLRLQGAAKKWISKVFRRFLSNRLGF